MLKKMIVLYILMLLTGCSNTTYYKDVIVTTTYPIYDFTKKIAGNEYKVVLLNSNNVDPHHYELSVNDIKIVNGSKMVIYNGVGYEGYIDDLRASVNDSVKFVNLSEDIMLINTDDNKVIHEQDPHIWLDPNNAMIMLESITDVLSEMKPAKVTYFSDNNDFTQGLLGKLDYSYRSELKDRKQDKFLVSHEAFGYLARAYDLEQVSLNGNDLEAVADAKRMAYIIDVIKDNNLHTIFTVVNSSSKTIDTVAAETGADVLSLNTLEYYSESEDYFSIMYSNLDALVEALK